MVKLPLAALIALSWSRRAVVGGVFLFRTYDYVQHDNEFCVSCHLMADPFDRVARSARGSTSTCGIATSRGYVRDAQQMVQSKVRLPDGYTLQWSGQYEYMQRARAKLLLVVPATLLLNLLLLYINFRSVTESLIVMLSLPFALVGGVLLMALLGYNWSVATAIGFIALAGVAAETGVVMLIYLDHAWDARRLHGNSSTDDLRDAIMEGAVERVRPKMMTVTAIIAGLLPILWGQGAGASVMKRIAAPMVGGMIASALLTLIVIPAVYSLWRQWEISRSAAHPSAAPPAPAPANT